MCIAIPGKVVEVDGLRAKVDYSGNQVMVNTGLVTPKVGQYVLVHAGCAIEVMEKDKAEEL
ncbi:MAG: HypC/HybG/HupF family hydrogenase formation chaperone, partial [Firmicutes bacterium]|nr:HypC/HybG/HupF family hydrogenase formation chaperone [Bacillota bacterium]